MIRLADILFSIFGILLLSPVFLIAFVFCWFDTGSPFFFQKRVGRGQDKFMIIKFRTMKLGTNSVATHLVDNSQITAVGCVLRKFKIDELPQLWNVFVGEMSFVGPRPCLESQDEVIKERIRYRVFLSRPGITGLAQIQGIDMSKPSEIAKVDAKMLSNFNIIHYLNYILLTFVKIVSSVDIFHRK